MEKDIGKISKNSDTEIIIRIDDFGGKTGVTIREFVSSDKYTGFTKAGTRISAEKFEDFKNIINSINVEELKFAAGQANEKSKQTTPSNSKSKAGDVEIKEEVY